MSTDPNADLIGFSFDGSDPVLGAYTVTVEGSSIMPGYVNVSVQDRRGTSASCRPTEYVRNRVAGR